MKDLKELYNTVDEIYKRHHINSDFAYYIRPQIKIQSNSLRIDVEDGVKSDCILELDEMFGKSCAIYPHKAGTRTMIELVYYFSGETNDNKDI